MKIGVSGKIDVTKIDKARLFVGQKGKYLDFTVFIDIDELDGYGNSGMLTQDVTKAEKDQGVKGPILGNCKVFWNDTQSQQQQQPQQQQQGGFQQQGTKQPQNQQPNQQQGGFQQQQPQQSQPQSSNQNNASSFQQQPPQQQGGFQGQQQAYQQKQQQAPKVNPQEPTIDFDDDLPF